jgi:beta-1,4-mannosyltransferase
MTKTGPSGFPEAYFPPASGLHGQVETLARELHEARARLVALDAATGESAPALRAPPLRLERCTYSMPETAETPPLPPSDAPWWPRPGGEGVAMAPAPGTRCAGLAQPGVPVLAVSCCGLTEDKTAAAIEAVVSEQIQTRSFVALFVTDDSRCLPLFRYQGLDVELVPSAEDLAACPGALDPDTFLARRIARIRETWGIAAVRDLGTRPLPWAMGPESELEATLRPLVVFDRDYRRHNPYQHLLHLSIPGLSFRPGRIDSAIASLVGGRDTAFHLNWEESIYRPAEDAAEAERMVSAFLASLDDFLAMGGPLVWTLHNEAPHEDRFPETYKRLAQEAAARSALVIVHSQRAAELARDRYGVAPERLCVVPHGSYHTLYAEDLTRAAARKALGLPVEGAIFGFVGAVRPYKNVPLLIDAFRRLLPGAARLLIAGKQMTPIEFDNDDLLRDHLILRDETIPETRLSAHLRACDVIVLPFGRILTSGSMMLALSVGIPVIVPDMPSLGEIVMDGVNGLTFPPGDADALAARMQDFLEFDSETRAAMERAAATSARLLSWDWIGRRVSGRMQALFVSAAAPNWQADAVPEVDAPVAVDPTVARRA